MLGYGLGSSPAMDTNQSRLTQLTSSQALPGRLQ